MLVPLGLVVPKRVPPARVDLREEGRVPLTRLARILAALLVPNVLEGLGILVHSKDSISRVVIKIFIVWLVSLKSP